MSRSRRSSGSTRRVKGCSRLGLGTRYAVPPRPSYLAPIQLSNGLDRDIYNCAEPRSFADDQVLGSAFTDCHRIRDATRTTVHDGCRVSAHGSWHSRTAHSNFQLEPADNSLQDALVTPPMANARRASNPSPSLPSSIEKKLTEPFPTTTDLLLSGRDGLRRGYR